MMKINKKYIRRAMEISDKAEGWKVSMEVLDNLCKEFKNIPKNLYITQNKIKIFNTLYSTGIRATLKLANRIVSTPNIDNIMDNGDIGFVDKLARFKERKFLVFASKFCHFHNPKAYPIWDRLVINSLKKMKIKKPKNYKEFKVIIDKIKPDTSYRNLDRFLWLFGAYLEMKKKRRNKGKKKNVIPVSDEIIKIFKTNPKYKKLFEEFEKECVRERIK